VFSGGNIGPVLACGCPSCGAPTPLSLAATTVQCRHCGATAAPPPNVAQQLQQASAVLGQIDSRQRQLSASERRALTSTWGSRVLYLLLALGILGPFVACGGCGVYISATAERTLWGFLALTLAPLAIMVLVVGLGSMWIRHKRRAFAVACAAVPPALTGGSAACHVCGAGLATSTEAIVRCSYCSADNVVEPSVLALAARQVVTVLDGFDQEVRRQATSVGKASRQASFATVGMGCVAPVGVLVLFFVVEWVILADYELPVHREYQYAAMPTKHGSCVCTVQTSGDRYFLHFGHLEGVENEFRDSVEDLTLHRATFVEGKQVRLIGSGKRGTVVRAYGSWHGGVNQVLVRTADGQQARTTVGGLCLGEAPAAPAGKPSASATSSASR
jgi:hypothetical protein